MKTFKHSGDLGDIIYSLIPMKELGGGILYLDVTGGEDDIYCEKHLGPVGGKTKLSINGINFIKELLEQQSYIEKVEIYDPEKHKINFNLNKFRSGFSNTVVDLIQANTSIHGLRNYDINNPWMQVNGEINLNKNTLIARTPRYQGAHCFLQGNIKNLQQNAVFIGTKEEHKLFEWAMGHEIDFYDTSSALEIAKLIKGTEIIICNSSFVLALSLALGHTQIYQETCNGLALTIFKNKTGMVYV